MGAIADLQQPHDTEYTGVTPMALTKMQIVSLPDKEKIFGYIRPTNFEEQCRNACVPALLAGEEDP